MLGNNLIRKTRIPQSDFPNVTAIYFNKYAPCFSYFGKDPKTKSSKLDFK